jgi:hypothetical protein
MQGLTISPVMLPRIQVFWNMKLRCWVSKCYNGQCDFEDEGNTLLQTWGTTHPKTQR